MSFNNNLLIENTTMVVALVDRLAFKPFVLDMNGESYQLEQTEVSITEVMIDIHNP